MAAETNMTGAAQMRWEAEAAGECGQGPENSHEGSVAEIQG